MTALDEFRLDEFTLPASLLSRIAALGIDLSLDLYPPTVDHDAPDSA